MTDTPWLRAMVEEELEELFSPDKHPVQRRVPRSLDRLPANLRARWGEAIDKLGNYPRARFPIS